MPQLASSIDFQGTIFGYNRYTFIINSFCSRQTKIFLVDGNTKKLYFDNILFISLLFKDPL